MNMKLFHIVYMYCICFLCLWCIKIHKSLTHSCKISFLLTRWLFYTNLHFHIPVLFRLLSSYTSAYSTDWSCWLFIRSLIHFNTRTFLLNFHTKPYTSIFSTCACDYNFTIFIVVNYADILHPCIPVMTYNAVPLSYCDPLVGP